jgi:hypothetical protein
MRKRRQQTAAEQEGVVDVDIRIGGLKPFKALGGLVLYAPSPADAQAEAHSNEAGQVYFGRGAVALQQGANCCADVHREF